MKTENEIIEICKSAKEAADKTGDNWADYVDGALTAAGVETDEVTARKLCNAGNMNVVAVTTDGRVVECWDDHTWHVNAIDDYEVTHEN